MAREINPVPLAKKFSASSMVKREPSQNSKERSGNALGTKPKSTPAFDQVLQIKQAAAQKPNLVNSRGFSTRHHFHSSHRRHVGDRALLNQDFDHLEAQQYPHARE